MLSFSMPNSAPRSLLALANLSKLLPTGTLLAAETLTPSFTNNGQCGVTNKYLTLAVVLISSVLCFLSSFTDSFVGDDGRRYYGFATFNGLYLFDKSLVRNDEVGDEELDGDDEKAAYRIRLRDFVHAFASVVVFLVVSLSSSQIQACFFPNGAGANAKALIINLPLGAGILASFLFVIFPTTRRGIGYINTQQKR